MQYSWPLAIGELTIRGESCFVDDVYFSPYNVDAVSQRSHNRHNAFITLDGGDGALSAFGRNLTNKDVIGTAAISTGLTGFIGTLEPPRTYGVQLEWRF